MGSDQIVVGWRAMGSKAKVGDLLLGYGGGGHDAAGTCQIANESADQALKEIVGLFNGTSSVVEEPALV